MGDLDEKKETEPLCSLQQVPGKSSEVQKKQSGKKSMRKEMNVKIWNWNQNQDQGLRGRRI